MVQLVLPEAGSDDNVIIGDSGHGEVPDNENDWTNDEGVQLAGNQPYWRAL